MPLWMAPALTSAVCLTITMDGKAEFLGAYFGPEMEKPEDAEEEDTFTPGMGSIIAHDIEAYITLALRDDELKITEVIEATEATEEKEATEAMVTVWLTEEYYGTLPRWLVRMEGDEPYESWTGYCRYASVVYEEYQMRNELQSPTTNTEVTVLDELPDCYVVELEDGTIGYMDLEDVSETKIRYSSGGGSTGSSDDSVWTPPAL